MVSIYRRPTSEQQLQLFRIVEGSIVNAVTSHKTWQFDRRFVTSIAKRVVGTLVAIWPPVLALDVKPTSVMPDSNPGVNRANRGFSRAKPREGVTRSPGQTPMNPTVGSI